MRWVLAIALATSACNGAQVPDAAGDAPRALGLNDITMLVPLPHDLGAPTVLALADNTLIAEGVFTALVLGRGDMGPKNGLPIAFTDFHLVALRFDLCNRTGVAPCPAGAAGRLRLVLQPLYRANDATLAHDIAIHAFYPVPAVELASVVDELRALARIQDAPIESPLGVSPALARGDVEYIARVRALVGRYAHWDQLLRLTAIGQDRRSAAFAWLFRGFDQRADGSHGPLVIPEVVSEEQSALLAGGDAVFDTRPLADSPTGFTVAINGQTFAAASTEQRAAAVTALSTIHNPRLHAPDSTQCIGCHVATSLLARRAQSAGIDASHLASQFTSPYNLAVDNIALTDPRVVRALGWVASFPAISHRVVYETAQVLSEIEERYSP